MTVLIEDLQALLEPLAAGGAWYGVCTASPHVYPFIVWQRIASSPTVALSGAADLQNTRVQIDLYGRQLSDLAALEAAVGVPADPNADPAVAATGLYKTIDDAVTE